VERSHALNFPRASANSMHSAGRRSALEENSLETAGRLIASMLFGLSPNDLPTVAAVSLLLLSVALFAGYLPARRASRIDPMVTLRMESGE